jgi:hypothetical protein
MLVPAVPPLVALTPPAALRPPAVPPSASLSGAALSPAQLKVRVKSEARVARETGWINLIWVLF